MTDATNPTDEVAPETGDTTDNTESVESLRAQLEEAQAAHARARADYANLERRSQEQRLEVGRAALTDAVRGFLPVLDDLLRAIEAAETNVTEGEAAWLEGVRLVAQKFKNVLDQHGVEEIDPFAPPEVRTRLVVQFLIADTFTASLDRLTGDEQKAVKQTVFDLQVNPESPGLNIEKLKAGRDKAFQSVRASQDIRIIIHRTAESLLVCYVDHHDAAYTWAERRVLERHPTTGAAQLVEVRETIDPGQLLSVALDLFVREGEAGEARDVPHFLGGQGHANAPRRTARHSRRAGSIWPSYVVSYLTRGSAAVSGVAFSGMKTSGLGRGHGGGPCRMFWERFQ